VDNAPTRRQYEKEQRLYDSNRYLYPKLAEKKTYVKGGGKCIRENKLFSITWISRGKKGGKP